MNRSAGAVNGVMGVYEAPDHMDSNRRNPEYSPRIDAIGYFRR